MIDKTPVQGIKQIEYKSNGRKTFKKIEFDRNKAIEENDVATFTNYVSDEWVIFSGSGNLTTKQMFLQYISGDLIHTELGFEILNVKIFGNTCMIMAKGTSSGIWKGQTFSNYEISSTSFIKQNGQWLAVQTMVAPATNL